jgi:hypothetical protein
MGDTVGGSGHSLPHGRGGPLTPTRALARCVLKAMRASHQGPAPMCGAVDATVLIYHIIGLPPGPCPDVWSR